MSVSASIASPSFRYLFTSDESILVTFSPHTQILAAPLSLFWSATALTVGYLSISCCNSFATFSTVASFTACVILVKYAASSLNRPASCDLYCFSQPLARLEHTAANCPAESFFRSAASVFTLTGFTSVLGTSGLKSDLTAPQSGHFQSFGNCSNGTFSFSSS